MGRITYGKWPHPASAYISGISAGILVRSNVLWPYFLTSLISITSKYVLRSRDDTSGIRPLWGQRRRIPGAGDITVFSIQWENVVAPMAIVWILIRDHGRVGRAHISATYVASFLLFSFVSSAITGPPWLATVAPITGPMYQLFIFFMVTDPKTTVRSKAGQCVVVFLIAFVEMVLRLNEILYAPFYAFFIVGPIAMLVEIWLESRRSVRLYAVTPYRRVFRPASMFLEEIENRPVEDLRLLPVSGVTRLRDTTDCDPLTRAANIRMTGGGAYMSASPVMSSVGTDIVSSSAKVTRFETSGPAAARWLAAPSAPAPLHPARRWIRRAIGRPQLAHVWRHRQELRCSEPPHGLLILRVLNTAILLATTRLRSRRGNDSA